MYDSFLLCSWCQCQETALKAKFQRNSIDDKVPSLIYLGHAKLMAKQTVVDPSIITTDAFTAKVAMLKKAMVKYHGDGIAAPQVGWWTRVFCFAINQGEHRSPCSVWVNPEIDTSMNTATNWGWEACLSVPGMAGWVERPCECIIRGLDEYGNVKEAHLKGLDARICQHEYDHLDGVLYTQRVSSTDFLVSTQSLHPLVRRRWPDNWPSAGARNTQHGHLSSEK